MDGVDFAALAAGRNPVASAFGLIRNEAGTLYGCHFATTARRKKGRLVETRHFNYLLCCCPLLFVPHADTHGGTAVLHFVKHLHFLSLSLSLS